VPRRDRGQDFGWWLERSGMTEYTSEGMPPDWRNSRGAPLLTGVRGGRTVDLRQLAREGITLLGSLLDAVDGHLHFAADLNANLKAGDDSFVHFVRTIDGFIEETGLAAPPEGGSTHICARRQKRCARSVCSTCAPQILQLSSGRQVTVTTSGGSIARCSTSAARRCSSAA
jgi:putative flavoprotein involved in K+ transport